MTTSSSELKTHARRLRAALEAEGIDVSHSKALELLARQHGMRDWNTLSAQSAVGPGAPFAVGDQVAGTFNGKPAKGHVFGIAQTIKPDLFRLTVAFDPPVDAATSAHFKAERRRVEMVVGRDGRSRRLTGTETGVMQLSRA